MKCSIARALDIVGDRWTILLVRELLTGHKRFKDLMLGLSGIGTNLLADRLKSLEKDGLIKKSRQAGDLGYELTEVGQDLEPALVYLARWGLKHGPKINENDLDVPSWNVLAFKAVFDPETAKHVREIYEIHIGDFIFSIRVWDGKIETRAGTDWRPDLTVHFTEEVFSKLSRGEGSMDDAITQGGAVFEGSAEALKHFEEIFSLVKVLNGPI